MSSITAVYVCYNRPRSIYQYSNMASRLSGQNCNFCKFCLSQNSQKDLDTIKTTPKKDVSPEILGGMLQYRYITRDVFLKHFFAFPPAKQREMSKFSAVWRT